MRKKLITYYLIFTLILSVSALMMLIKKINDFNELEQKINFLEENCK